MNSGFMKSKWYWTVKIFLILLTITAFAVIISMSWYTVYDRSPEAVNNYDNYSNKLYWYVFINHEGTWLPIVMLLVIVVCALLLNFVTPRKPSFSTVHKELAMLKDCNHITTYHQQLADEVITIVQQDAKNKDLEHLDEQNAIVNWIELIKKQSVKIMSLGHKALSAEKKKELQQSITDLIEQKTQEFVTQAQTEAAEQEAKLNQQRKELNDKLTDTTQPIALPPTTQSTVADKLTSMELARYGINNG